MKEIHLSEHVRHEAVNDEINLLEIWQWLKCYKWLLLAATMAGMVIGAAMITWTQPVWKADALIQVGRVGWAEQVIEPITRITTRLEDVSYIRRIEKGLQDSATITPIHVGVLQAKPVPGSDFIRLSLSAHSKELAKKLISATVDQLKAEHEEIIRPAIERRKLQLAAIERDILSTKTAEKELEQWIASGKASTNFFIYMTLRQQIMANEHELDQKKMMLGEQMDATRTYPTSLIGEINVDDRPVSPKKGALVLLGAIVGLLVGMFMAFIRHFFKHVSIRQ
jgi:LPS O-antigen subunit length determinant protein (WzzB/FepE family)